MLSIEFGIGRFFFLTKPLAVSDAGYIASWHAIFALLVVIGVFFTTSVKIVNTSVNLIHIVPDTELSWIAPGTQSAGAGSQMSGQFSNAASGVAGYGGAIAKQSMGKAREAGRGIADGNNQAASAAQSKARHDEMIKAMGGSVKPDGVKKG